MKLHLVFLWVLLALPAAHAQNALPTRQPPTWQQTPVPYYSTAHFLQGLYTHWGLKGSAQFVADTRTLSNALAALCQSQPEQSAAALQKARTAWQIASGTWKFPLSGIAFGPLIERRSLRQIETFPARPALIQRNIKTQPQGAKAFERVGTPAKGLPALEWLLWSNPVQPATPACSYAHEVALDIEREAHALQTAFQQAAATDWTAEETQDKAHAAMTEFINQWIGGIERLRWADMEKPLRATQGLRAPDWPSSASQTTISLWSGAWFALRTVTVHPTLKGKPPVALPIPGAELVSLEMYLRGRGLNPLADRLVQAVADVHTALFHITQVHAAKQDINESVLQATRALSALKRLGEAEIAPALQITIGFSDADGD